MPFQLFFPSSVELLFLFFVLNFLSFALHFPFSIPCSSLSKWANERIHVTVVIEWQKTGSAHVLASRVYIHPIVPTNVVLQGKEPSGMVSLLQVYLVDEFQPIARWTAEGKFQFEVFLHHLIVYELLFKFFHVVIADVVDVGANQA